MQTSLEGIRLSQNDSPTVHANQSLGTKLTKSNRDCLARDPDKAADVLVGKWKVNLDAVAIGNSADLSQFAKEPDDSMPS